MHSKKGKSSEGRVVNEKDKEECKWSRSGIKKVNRIHLADSGEKVVVENKLVGRDSELHRALYKEVMLVFHLCLRLFSRGSFSCRYGREMCLGYGAHKL